MPPAGIEPISEGKKAYKINVFQLFREEFVRNFLEFSISCRIISYFFGNRISISRMILSIISSRSMMFMFEDFLRNSLLVLAMKKPPRRAAIE